MTKYGMPPCWFKCHKCGKKSFKPAGCTIKKCDWCKTKHKFEEFTDGSFGKMTTTNSRVLKVLP